MNVEAELMDGSVSLDVVARRAEVSKASVYRHAKNHLLPRVKSKLEAATQTPVVDDAELGALEALDRLSTRVEVLPLYKRLMRLAITAEREKNWPATRAFLSEARQTLELGARVHGEFVDAIALASAPRQPFVLILQGKSPAAGVDDDEPLTIDVTAQR
jgi:AcrR family transcriptional regulator